MYPILLHIGKIAIFSHGVLMILGIALGGYVIYRLARFKKMQTNLILDIIVWSILFGIIGARVLYILLYPEQFTNWLGYFEIWGGGMVSFGGIIGGLVAAFIFLKSKKEPILAWFDIGFVGLLAGWSIGRIGCFLDGDDLGLPTLSPLAILGRWPTPLFESIAVLIVAVFLVLLLIRFKKITSGAVFAYGVMLYSLVRFFVDFTKSEQIMALGLKYGQFGSVIIFALAFIFLTILYTNNLKRKEKNAEG